MRDNILANFDIESNFWQTNPQMKVPKPYSKIWMTDEGGEESSKIMWAIMLLMHGKSKFHTLSIIERKKIIAEDYLKQKDFVWKDDGMIAEAVEFTKNFVLSPARRLAYQWQEKLEERSMFMASLNYKLETVDTLDKMLSSTSKMYDMYQKVLEALEKEETQGDVQGGAMESLTESGKI